MKEKLKQIRTAALEQLDAVDSTEKLEQLRVKFLGKKGELTAVIAAWARCLLRKGQR